ncbi:DUF2249 domain-containing protein [Halocatena marina]|uniref:DUF2249 domain-containing protein n=1 Tax=Halocatena marina TaxID=2934937 RepID=UPI002010A21E|nr:DUF2249 domain-containing protein [Halocatena marina]
MGTDTDDNRIHELDCREIAGNPFREILAALDALPKDETLVLIADHEPEPFYPVLEEHGYTYETSQATDEEWCVTITEE